MTNQQIEALLNTLRALVHGDNHGPTGLEMLSMSIAKGGEPTLSANLEAGLSSIAEAGMKQAEALENVSNSLDKIAECLYTLAKVHSERP